MGLIELGKHKSVIQPPKTAFYQPLHTTSSMLVASPGRRVSIRLECIDQLQKLHSLLGCGAITKDQYHELQGTILSDIRNL